MLQLTQNEKRTLNTTMRMVVYFFVLIAVMLGIWKLTDIWGPDTFDENGIIENAQCVILAAAFILFGVMAWKNKSYRLILTGLMSLCILGICREQDAWFDMYLPLVSWQIGYFPIVFTMLYDVEHFKHFKKQLIDFLQTPGFSLMFCAMVMIIPGAQCIGHRPLIEAVVPGESGIAVHILRRMIEESGEIIGYVLILLAAIELSLNLRKNSTNS